MHTTATASLRMPGSIEAVFAAATTDARMVAAFDGVGPIPGIDRIENLGPELAVGLERIIHSSDGTGVRERVEVLEPPHRQAYTLSDFKGPFRFLVRGARAEWTFTADGDHTDVHWHYTFETTSFLAWPIVRVLMPFFARAQAKCLAALAEGLSGAAE